MSNSPNNKLWYKQAANAFHEALPVGNGRLGGMVYGKAKGNFFFHDKLLINEDSVWSKSESENRQNPDSLKHLDEIRQLLLAGKHTEAQHLSQMAMRSGPKQVAAYQPLCEMQMSYIDRTPCTASDPALSDYRRSLDLNTGIALTEYTYYGIAFRQEVFSSMADDVIVIRFEADKPTVLSLYCWLARRPFQGICESSGNSISMHGSAGGNGVAYSAQVSAKAEGGSVETIGSHLVIKKADCLTLIIAGNTDFRCDDPVKVSKKHINRAFKLSYQKLKERHVAIHSKLYERVSLDLHGNDELGKQPTDERLKAFKAGVEDNGLVELLFNYGRYLLIASSMPGTLPANLQGIWNDSFAPPWESAYTININTQMNYWPAEVCALSECHQPLFDMIERLCENGQKTAKEMYGCKGSVVHHNTDLTADTALTGAGCDNNIWSHGGAWLALHMWEHYRFTKDDKFLIRYYPVMRKFGEFYLDYLYEDENGQLLCGPSMSPENCFYMPGQKTRIATMCMATTMDSQIVRALFKALSESARALKLNTDAKLFSEKSEKLPPTKISKSTGRIMEWREDYDESDPGHRHVSHLFGLFPAEEISPITSPELAAAAEKTLDFRLSHGGGYTGWSAAWTICFYARLLKAEKAVDTIRNLFKQLIFDNMFNVHPPAIFQIDGNLGASAGIAEMLLQSHEDFLHFLPALPKQWTDGEVKALAARGGFDVSFKWSNGVLENAKIFSRAGSELRVLLPWQQKIVTTQTKTGGCYQLKIDGSILEI